MNLKMLPLLLWVLMPHTLIAQRTPGETGRTYAPVQWEAISVVPGALDSPLLRPGLLGATGALAIVFDYGDSRLKAFSLSSGKLLWEFGRRGQGPSEFSNPTHLETDASGNTWILDPQLRRITVVDADGSKIREIPLSVTPNRVSVHSNGKLVAYDLLGSDLQAAILNLEDGVIASALTLPEPLGDLTDKSTLPADGQLATIGALGVSVLGLFWTGHLMVISPLDDIVRELHAVQVLPAPRVVSYSPRANMTVNRLAPGSTRAILGLSGYGSTAYVLFGGHSSESGRIIDSYELGRDSETYVGSYLLPRPARKIAATSEGFLVIEGDPFPALTLWRVPSRHRVERR